MSATLEIMRFAADTHALAADSATTVHAAGLGSDGSSNNALSRYLFIAMGLCSTLVLISLVIAAAIISLTKGRTAEAKKALGDAVVGHGIALGVIVGALGIGGFIVRIVEGYIN